MVAALPGEYPVPVYRGAAGRALLFYVIKYQS
jgi:hypothetical protein